MIVKYSFLCLISVLINSWPTWPPSLHSRDTYYTNYNPPRRVQLWVYSIGVCLLSAPPRGPLSTQRPCVYSTHRWGQAHNAITYTQECLYRNSSFTVYQPRVCQRNGTAENTSYFLRFWAFFSALITMFSFRLAVPQDTDIIDSHDIQKIKHWYLVNLLCVNLFVHHNHVVKIWYCVLITSKMHVYVSVKISVLETYHIISYEIRQALCKT